MDLCNDLLPNTNVLFISNLIAVTIFIGIHLVFLGYPRRQCTMLQAGRLQVRVPLRSFNFFNLPNPSSCTMALGFTQPLTEMSTGKSFLGGRGVKICRLTRKFGIFDISQSHRPPRPVTGIALLCFNDSFSNPDYVVLNVLMISVSRKNLEGSGRGIIEGTEGNHVDSNWTSPVCKGKHIQPWEGLKHCRDWANSGCPDKLLSGEKKKV
jgi:hypothetical protein